VTALPCPLCGGASSFLATLSDLRYRQTHWLAHYQSCSDCGCAFQHPQPTREQAASFYGQGYWGESKQAGWLARGMKGYVSAMLRLDLLTQVRAMERQPGRQLLDFGCSRGDWLALLARRGWQVAGVDGDARAVEAARSHFGLQVELGDAESWQETANSLDALSLLHVLEHTHHPAAFLARCHRALRPNGLLLLRVPAFESLQSRLLGKAWKGLEPPRHLWQFTYKGLFNLLEKNGFTIIRHTTWSWRDGPPGWSSSLFPSGEPTRQAILGMRAPWKILLYFTLTWSLTPLEALAALLRRGGMHTLLAGKIQKEPSSP
jgi:SAM-dependent methyltransferase